MSLKFDIRPARTANVYCEGQVMDGYIVSVGEEIYYAPTREKAMTIVARAAFYVPGKMVNVSIDDDPEWQELKQKDLNTKVNWMEEHIDKLERKVFKHGR